jgi:hypothetical protein
MKEAFCMDERVFEWIQHGCGLRRDLLDKARWLIAHGRMTPAEERELEKEIDHQGRVMLLLRGYAIQLKPADLAWRDYMVGHARLQLDRLTGLLTEREFLARCYALIDEREARLKGLDDDRYTRRSAS